jgi:hypothetical protein
MKYFTSFDYINYTFPDGVSRVFNNLSTRVDVLDKILESNTNFQEYNIKDKTYSLYNDWPKTQKQLNTYLLDKYRTQKTMSDSEVVLSDLVTNEFIRFAGSPSNSFEDSDGKYGVLYRPHHFEDAKGVVYSFDTGTYYGNDVFGNTYVQPTLTPVSIYDYEFELNEAKRNIIIPNQNLVEIMKTELRNLANE